MSYLNQNQKSTFKKLLLSTAVIGSVVCASTGAFAMDDEEKTSISNRTIKADQAIVSLLYYQAADNSGGHNAVLFEWKEQENQPVKTFFATYNATEPVSSGIWKVATEEASTIDPEKFLESNFYGKLKVVGQPLINIGYRDKSVSGGTVIMDQIEDIKNFKQKVGFEVVESWGTSVEEAKNGMTKAREIDNLPTKYSLAFHITPSCISSLCEKVDHKKYNSISLSEALLNSAGLTGKRRAWEIFPCVWNPKGR